MPFSVRLGGRTKELFSPAFSLLPSYTRASGLLEILSFSSLLLKHTGIIRASANAKITADSTAAITIQTILFVEDLFEDFDSTVVVDGPAACVTGVLSEGVLFEEDPPPLKKGDWCDGAEGVGDGKGAALEMNGFPSFLQNKRNCTNHISCIHITRKKRR